MKQYANHISLVPVLDVTSIENNVITLKSGKTLDEISLSNDIEFSEKPKNSKAGVFYEQTSEAVTEDKLSDTLRDRYANGRYVILVLYQEELSVPVIVGSLDIPTIIYITPGADHDILSFERMSNLAVL